MNKFSFGLTFGLTLIELLVTVALIAILASVTIAHMRTVKRPQDLVDNATTIIENLLTQASSNSLTTTNPEQTAVCKLKYDSTSGFAKCDITATTWDNVNGNALPRVTVSTAGLSASSNNTITYTQGYQNNITTTNPTGKVSIKITSTDNSNCFNTINVWPNGILDIDTSNTISAACRNPPP